MEAILSDITALTYWRTDSDALGNPSARNTALPERRGVVAPAAPTVSGVADLQMWGLIEESTPEIHLLVTDRNQRRHIEGVKFTVQSGAVPKGSFLRVRGQVYAVCPELLFVQLAARLSTVELLEVGYELCGTYRMVNGTPVYWQDPLTSVSKLRSYAQRAKGMRGRAKAEQATRWLADNSASPAETALAIMFKLPLRLGGCALPDFQLNRELALNAAAAHIFGRDYLRPDFFFLHGKHPSEYDSARYHDAGEQAEFDERRRNAYNAMGMSVTVFRPRHLVNADLFDDMVASIRRNTGTRLQAPPANYDQAHRDLFYEVFRYWNDLKDDLGTGEEFAQRAAAWSEPKLPW